MEGLVRGGAAIVGAAESDIGAVAAELISEGTASTDVGFMDPARFGERQPTAAARPPDGAASYSELL